MDAFPEGTLRRSGSGPSAVSVDVCKPQWDRGTGLGHGEVRLGAETWRTVDCGECLALPDGEELCLRECLGIRQGSPERKKCVILSLAAALLICVSPSRDRTQQVLALGRPKIVFRVQDRDPLEDGGPSRRGTVIFD